MVWFLFVEVCFDNTDPNELASAGIKPINHAGLTFARICVYHIHNAAATDTPYNVRRQLEDMMWLIAKYQIDIVGGDANAALYRYFGN